MSVSTGTASCSPKINVEVLGSNAGSGPNGRTRSATMAFSGAVKTLMFNAGCMVVELLAHQRDFKQNDGSVRPNALSRPPDGECLFHAHKGMAALARTPVLPVTTPVGALSAHLWQLHSPRTGLGILGSLG